MSLLSRRTFTKGLLASALVPGNLAFGQPNDAGSVAVIDTPHNAAKYAAKLAAQNVKVVVRFYARKAQPGLREKIMASDGNMIDGVREPTILIRNGLSILSLYQYRNNLPEKFMKGLEDTGSAKAEVAADAKAALEQAKLVGQPEGSAIYFGVDFNVTKCKCDGVGQPVRTAGGDIVPNNSMVDAVLDYFRFMNQTETVGPMNLGNPGEFTMLQLAQLTLKLVGGKSKIVHKPLPPDDPKQRQPDITLARKLLKWEPKVPLEEGLKRTVAYFRTKV